MNFESLLLKEFSSNGMTKPLKTIIGVAIFSVNFPLQRKKGRNLLRPFRIVLVLNTQHFFNSLFNEGERHKVFNLALFESCKGFDFENLFSALLIQATEQLVSESFATAI